MVVMTRIFRSALLGLMASVLAPALQAAPDEASSWSLMQFQRAEDIRIADRAFSSSFDLFYTGPQWFMNAISMPSSTRLARLRSSQLLTQSSGDRVVQEAAYVGTLRDTFDVNLFSNVIPFARASGTKTSSVLSFDATGATIEWTNVGTDWATGANWVGGTAPADSPTINIALFGSAGAGRV